MDRIQRNGEWWQRQPTGEWLRFDATSGQWIPGGSPPPPPPPPPADVFGESPYVPLETGRRSRFTVPRISVPQIDRRVGMAAGLAVLVATLAIAGFMVFGGNEPGADLAAAASASLSEPKLKSKKAQFIHDADQICADIMTKVNGVPTPTTMEQLVEGMETVRSILVEARSVGSKLNVPKDARKGWTRMMGTDAEIAEFDAVIAALKQGNLAAVQAWEQENKGSGARDRKWAKRYGMKVCSQELG